MGDFFNTIIWPIEWLVAWIMYGFHQVFTWHRDEPGLGVDLGAVDRRPRRRHAGGDDPAVRQADPGLPPDAADPARDAEDPEEVQGQARPRVPAGDDPGDDGPLQAGGTNPFSSCLPILVQSPFFFGLFRVLNSMDEIAVRQARRRSGRSPSRSRSRSSRRRSSARSCPSRSCRPDATCNVQIVTVVLIILMSATTFTTQRQLMTQEHAGVGAGQPVRQAAEDAALRAAAGLRRLRRELPDRCAHLLVHHQPVVDGPAVLRHPRMPAPGSAAEKAYHARLERKGKPIPGAEARQGQGGCRRRGGGRARQAAGQRQQPTPRSARRARPPARSRAGLAPPTPRRATLARDERQRPRRSRANRHPRKTAAGTNGSSSTDAGRQGAPARTPATGAKPPTTDPPDRRRTT